MQLGGTCVQVTAQVATGTNNLDSGFWSANVRNDILWAGRWQLVGSYSESPHSFILRQILSQTLNMEKRMLEIMQTTEKLEKQMQEQNHTVHQLHNCSR